MITEIVNFTPWSALGGGLMIGLAALLLLAFNGRIAGVAGILHSLPAAPDRGWRLLFLFGLIAGAAAYLLAFPGAIEPRQGFPLPLLVVAGLLVGAGTRLGSGCTSGHGVCGIARWSVRSLVATGVFMAVGVVAAVALRHGLGVTS